MRQSVTEGEIRPDKWCEFDRGEAGIKSAVGAGSDFKVEQSFKSLEQGRGELM